MSGPLFRRRSTGDLSASLRRWQQERAAREADAGLPPADERPYTAAVLARFGGNWEAVRAAELRDRQEALVRAERVQDLLAPIVAEIERDFPALAELPERARAAALQVLLEERLARHPARTDVDRALMLRELDMQILRLRYTRVGDDLTDLEARP